MLVQNDDSPDAGLELSWIYPMPFHLSTSFRRMVHIRMFYTVSQEHIHVTDLMLVMSRGCLSLWHCSFSVWKRQLPSLHLEIAWISHHNWTFSVWITARCWNILEHLKYSLRAVSLHIFSISSSLTFSHWHILARLDIHIASQVTILLDRSVLLDLL